MGGVIQQIKYFQGTEFPSTTHLQMRTADISKEQSFLQKIFTNENSKYFQGTEFSFNKHLQMRTVNISKVQSFLQQTFTN